MTRIALPAALAVVLAGSLAFAQQPQPQPAPEAQAPAATAPAHAQNPHKQTMKLAKELALTPDQTAKVEPILADRDQKLAALRADSTIAPKTFKQQMHAIQKSTRDQLDSLLTPAQIEQFKTMHAHGAKAPNTPLTPAPAV
jgi:periplasmic protein CpxP/Spy